MILHKVHVDYDFSQFVDADYTQHTGTCIAHQIHELEDIHKQYGGFPDSYTTANTTIHQLWWEQDSVDFDHLGKQLNMEVVTVSSIQQPAGQIIPLHRDTFYQIHKRYPDNNRPIVRANIYLEAWKMGHLIQYWDGNRFQTDTHWNAGDGWLWDSEPVHIGANCGFEPKLTLQISGFYLRK